MSKFILLRNGCFNLKWPFLFYIVCLFAFITNCQKEVSEKEQTLVKVNGIKVSVIDFEQKYVGHLIKTGRNDTRKERNIFLKEIIDNLVLADAASHTNYISNQTYINALDYQERRSLGDYYYVDELGKRLEAPTDEQLRLAFAKSKRKVYVRHLFSLRKEDLDKPYQELISGASFVKVANEFYKTEAFDSLAGYLGPITYLGIDDNFAETAFSLNEGEFSKPIRSQFGYHIIYVEHVLFEALITESEYQTRKPGIENKIKMRNQELKGNEYIRELMGSLSVEADRDQILKVKEKINNISLDEPVNEGPDTESSDKKWSDSQVEKIGVEMDEEEILATYVLEGNKQDFTFGDYLKWLPFLSFSESKTRTGASVGRAMRNQVLYQLAVSNGYKEDSRVKDKVRQRGYEVLSKLYQRDLVLKALKDTSTVPVPSSFRDRLVKGGRYNLIATYWKIKAKSLNEAKSIREEVEEGKQPGSYESFRKSEAVSYSSGEPDYTLIRDALVNTPTAAHSTEDGWMVLNVLNREFVEIASDTSITDISVQYKVFSYLETKIDSLRNNADVSVDTALFNEIYDLSRSKKEKKENS